MTTEPDKAPQSQPTNDPLEKLFGESLEAEKTRSEINKLRVEVEELRAWKSKLVFTSVLAVFAPLGSIVLFFVGWFGSHASERIHQGDELYNRAATQLSSPDASVRLSAVTTLDHFAQPPASTSIGVLSERLFTSRDSVSIARQRPQETMALLIGRLSVEDDQAVLDAIAGEVSKNPIDSVTPLLSMNKTAAVGFSRAAGQFSGLSILKTRRLRSLEQDDLAGKGACDPSVTDVVNVVLRTGSPFEATARFNQQFASKDFLTNARYPFRELFKKQQRLALSSDMSDVIRPAPPSDAEVEKALAAVIEAAAKLERSSYILGSLATERWDVLEPKDLFGTAIAVGDITPEVVTKLRSRGAYFQSPQDNKNPCSDDHGAQSRH